MVKRFVHTITFNLSTQGEAYQNADGDMIYPEPVLTSVNQICRAEPNGTGNKTPNQDSVLVEYAYTVYMPVNSTPIPFNQDVTIYNGTEIIGQGTAKRFHRGQLNCVAWV